MERRMNHPAHICGQLEVAITELRRRLAFADHEAQVRQLDRVQRLNWELQLAIQKYQGVILTEDLSASIEQRRKESHG
jgi:hypothetical protein